MPVEQLSQQQQPTDKKRSDVKFPGYDLATCVEVPRAIHAKGGGAATPELLASYLGYKGTNNGAFISKVASARTFGLIAKQGNLYIATSLAHRILSPVYPHEAQQGLIDAFLNVELYRKIYEDFKGRELPPEFGMKNALRQQFGVLSGRVDDAYRNLLDSAETAGFFAAKMGARTHLIMPMVHVQTPAQMPPEQPSPDYGGGKGGGDGGSEPPAPPPHVSPTIGAVGDVKAKYLAALIKVFEAKSNNGELDEKLMERIERLLGAEGKP
jgi:hypothetical protein